VIWKKENKPLKKVQTFLQPEGFSCSFEGVFHQCPSSTENAKQQLTNA